MIEKGAAQVMANKIILRKHSVLYHAHSAAPAHEVGALSCCKFPKDLVISCLCFSVDTLIVSMLLKHVLFILLHTYLWLSIPFACVVKNCKPHKKRLLIAHSRVTKIALIIFTLLYYCSHLFDAKLIDFL